MNGSINILFCDNDTDTTIIKGATYTNGEPINGVADVTNIICLFLHHTTVQDLIGNVIMAARKALIHLF